MPNAGLIGLGLLGSALAQRMLAAGFSVTGYDPCPQATAAAAAMGCTTVGSSSDVFSACRVVVLSLPNAEIVEEVLAQASGQLTVGHLIVDTTTGDPDRMATVGGQLLQRGIEYLDATIAASSAQVLVGDAVVMVGGDAAAFQTCEPLFATFARQSVHVGPSGNGARMKLVNNLMLGLSRAALAEALTFAGKCGLDRRAALEVLRAGNAYSRVMDTKGEKMLVRDFTPQGRLAQHLKDVRLILDCGRRSDAALPLTETHRTLLETCQSAGLGEQDNSAVIMAYENPSSADSAIAHVTIATRDVQRTVTFFQCALGCKRINPPANAPAHLEAAWVQVGPLQQIHIAYLPDFACSPFEAEFGRHVALFHPVSGFPALKQRLIEHGATLMDSMRTTPFERFFFRDFNGYVFEVIAREQYVTE
jgi:3-hydroxyisobutyrate dehydrogenase-like beta-hydroxyacid dehydrogenase/catechol 2,3-dioxygenase-like lactoylglutathione lyase family enzyme